MLTREIVQGVGAFAKYLATEAVTKGGIPGLAAMEPDGKFIEALNQTQAGQAAAAESQFYAILSQFDPKSAATAKEIPRQLLLALTNGLIDRLMKEANDLVVNTASMTMIDPAAGSFIKDQRRLRSERRHLPHELLPPATDGQCAHPLAGVAAAGKRNARATTPGHRAGNRYADGDPGPHRHGRACASATEPVGEAKAALEMMQPSYVVIERRHEGATLRYAYPPNRSPRSRLRTIQRRCAKRSPCGSLKPRRAGSIEALPASDFDCTERDGPALHRDGGRSRRRRNARHGAPIDGRGTGRTSCAINCADDRDRQDHSAPWSSDVYFHSQGCAACRSSQLRRRKVSCHFQAEMDGEVQLGKTATIEVLISREAIAAAARLAASGTSEQVDPSRQLIVQLLAKAHFDSVGETRVELAVPAPGQPQSCYFDVEPTNEGDGEIWIVIRQGQVPLVNLILRPKIVAQKPARTRRIQAPAITAEAPALAEPLHQLRIFERRRGDEVFYQFIFDSPALNLNSIFDSAPIPGRSECLRQSALQGDRGSLDLEWRRCRRL